MNIPFISIIIPTYNSEATLSIALESILNQTFKNWEIVIMDGLSADATIEIAKRFQTQFENKIKIYSEEDKGIYDAMNKGIDLAQGAWLYFMGSDDSFYESTTLEKISKIDAIGFKDVIYGNVTSTRFNGIYDGEFDYSKLSIKNICHQSIFLNEKVFKKIGRFNLKYKVHADWDHNIRWVFNSHIKKLYTNLIVAHYADGGYSSVERDDIFSKDKRLLLLKVGIGKLTNNEWYKDYSKALRLAKMENRYAEKIRLFKLRVLFKLHKTLK